SHVRTDHMKRLHQVLLIATFLPLCWLAMMVVHELGHVFGAVITGGTVESVILHPLTISRTDVSPNPHPLAVVWAGPFVGVLLLLAILVVFKTGKIPLTYLVQFFAGFCLIANGAYIGFGSFSRVGDAGDMLRHGSPIWCLWLFGVATFPLGLYLWNRLGPYFGLGLAAGKVEHIAAYVSCILLILTIILEVALSARASP
ncbi:MAG: M50 family metallopeptidase, partial [Thermoguttaceae bacterium]